MGDTLSLKKEPPMDFDGHYGEVHGPGGDPDGVRFVQGRKLYGNKGQFVKDAPKEMWMTPLTQEQEDNRRRQMQANRKFFAAAKPRVNDTGVPQAVVNAERENARARAAENAA
jgi:hypothetical protein